MSFLSKTGLLPRVLIAIALGVALSFLVPDWFVRIFLTFNSLFGNFLSLFIPILIIGLIAPGIADLGSGAGKLLLITTVIAYLSTIIAGFFSFGVCNATYETILGDTMKDLRSTDFSGGMTPYFTIDMPPFISVTSALVISFILGLCLAGMQSNTMRNLTYDLRYIVFKVINKVIIPCLPVFIFGIFLDMGAEGKVAPVLGMFAKIILLIFAMHVTYLVFQFSVAGAISHKNPFKSLLNMLPAYVTALGTQSSAATIPVTMQCVKKNGVRDDVAEFTVPLCANIHLSASILKIVACAVAISMGMGMDYSLHTYAGFIMMLSITLVAAPGVPGGAIMASLGLMASMLGFDSSLQGLMIALYITMDSFGTAGNVTGDGAIALIINKIKSK